MSRPVFRAAPLRVRVPATSANLGPGFDSFGLALERYDDLVAQVVDEPGVRVDIGGEGADLLPRDGKHLVAKVMRRAFDAMGGQPRGLDLVFANRIPHKRGLGSSAAAIVGGLVLARALVVGGDELLPDDRLLSLAASMEGHPDNAAACLFGGFTIAWMQQDSARALRLSAHPSIRPVVLMPPTTSSTRRARGLLPELVPHADAAFTAARAALLVHAITTDPSLLLTATEERLHQQQRREAYPRSVDAVTKLRDRGIAATISGAGPTVLVLATDGQMEDTLTGVKEVAKDRFEIAVLPVDTVGASVVPLT
jgi:homoserine kinase